MVNIDDVLYNEIKEYCKINNLKLGKFINTLLKQSFNIQKYGEKPLFFNKPKDTPKPIEVFPQQIEEIVQETIVLEEPPITNNPITVYVEPKIETITTLKTNKKRVLS